MERIVRVRQSALLLAAGMAALLLLSGSAQPGGSIEQDRHRQCAELVWERGGRVVDSDGTSRQPASFKELLSLPGHCPELGTNELLHPSSH